MSDALKEAHEIIEHFKHYGPGPHKGSGTPQAVHAGFKKMGGAGVLAAVGGMERTQAREYVARLRVANPKKIVEAKPIQPKIEEQINPYDMTLVGQYHTLKKQYPSHILFMNIGGFYKTFESDADTISRIFDIRQMRQGGARMAEIPERSVSDFFGKLIDAGYTIAVAEQKG